MCVNDITSSPECPCLVFANDIRLLGSANGECIHRDLDKIYQWSARWDLPLKVSSRQELMEGEANLTRYMGLAGHRDAM